MKLYFENSYGARISAAGTAYISDGEYQYYNVPRLNKNWFNKQPFDYVVWIN